MLLTFFGQEAGVWSGAGRFPGQDFRQRVLEGEQRRMWERDPAPTDVTPTGTLHACVSAKAKSRDI